MLRIDCGEYQSDHEVSKLIGSPPGYLGHRETPPLLNQQKVDSFSSDKSELCILVFDEIEKASDAMARLLLGILDKAFLRLGDNSTVNFERCLIFLTSNLGSKEMQVAKVGFGEKTAGFNKQAAHKALRAKFSPEFRNRIDNIVVYKTLGREECRTILQQLTQEFQRLVGERLYKRSFKLELSEPAREEILNIGVSKENGARELRRTAERELMQPLCSLIAAEKIKPSSTVLLDYADGQFVFLERR